MDKRSLVLIPSFFGTLRVPSLKTSESIEAVKVTIARRSCSKRGMVDIISEKDKAEVQN